MILLGYITKGSENLNVRHPLATECPLMAGYATVIVPNVQTRIDYVVALFGDSGNISPQFTINTSQSIIRPRPRRTI